MQNDTIQRFLFENHAVRGEIVHLKSSYMVVKEQHHYPDPVAELLGKALCAATLLCTPLKYEGSLILQIQGDGPISSLVTQCNHHLHIRGLARWDETALLRSTKQLLGQGHLAITVMPDNSTERYQGIVSVENDNLAQMLEQYFNQSEQLPTRIWLAANASQACGLLLQQIPNNKTPTIDFWQHITHLAETITHQELLTLDTETLLYRLFHEEDIRLFETHPVCFRCRCNLEKMEQALLIAGKDEMDDIFKTNKTVDVTCEFCNRHYAFDNIDIECLFHGK